MAKDIPKKSKLAPTRHHGRHMPAFIDYLNPVKVSFEPDITHRGRGRPGGDYQFWTVEADEKRPIRLDYFDAATVLGMLVQLMDNLFAGRSMRRYRWRMPDKEHPEEFERVFQLYPVLYWLGMLEAMELVTIINWRKAIAVPVHSIRSNACPYYWNGLRIVAYYYDPAEQAAAYKLVRKTSYEQAVAWGEREYGKDVNQFTTSEKRVVQRRCSQLVRRGMIKEGGIHMEEYLRKAGIKGLSYAPYDAEAITKVIEASKHSLRPFRVGDFMTVTDTRGYYLITERTSYFIASLYQLGWNTKKKWVLNIE